MKLIGLILFIVGAVSLATSTVTSISYFQNCNNRTTSGKAHWPWNAAIYHLFDDISAYRCAGTLIHSTIVLTAARCVFEDNKQMPTSNVEVQLGKMNLKDFGSNVQEFQVQEIISHPGFNPSNLANDIAIIRLSSEATLNDFVQPVGLWESNRPDLSEVTNKLGTVIGYGITHTSTGQRSHTLQQSLMPVITKENCLLSKVDFFKTFLTEKKFCAGFRNGTSSVCDDDTGGSMTFEENGVYRVIGCDPNEYVLFTDVAHFLPWIKENWHQVTQTTSVGKTSLANYVIENIVAPKHGRSNGGNEYKIECPHGGAFTGIIYRAGWRVDQIQFVCKSAKLEATFGPYGGSSGGSAGSLHCPRGLYISSFYGRSGETLDRLGIRCRQLNEDLSAYGVLQNSFGGNGGNEFDDLLPSIGRRPISITVRAGKEVDAIQVTYANTLITDNICDACKKHVEVWTPQHGGNGGGLSKVVCPAGGVITGMKYKVGSRLGSIEFRSPFDDNSFSLNDQRPVEIEIRSGWFVDSNRVKYENLPLPNMCNVSKIEVKDKIINAHADGFHVISFLSISSYSNTTQLTFENDHSVTETIDVDTTEEEELDWSTEVSLTYTTRLDNSIKKEVNVGLSRSVGKSWSHTARKSATAAVYSQGTKLSYSSPGAYIVYGYMKRYKTERESLPAIYHFTCDMGSMQSKVGKIKLSSTIFGKAHFENYNSVVESQADSTDISDCLGSIKTNKFVSKLSVLEEQIENCFQ